MSNSQPPEKEILKSVLEPLLEDFQYWFARSRTLLENQRLGFFSAEEQTELLQRVKQSQQEVSTVQMMFKAMNGEVGIESRQLVPWHQLVAECWQVSMRWRSWQRQQNQANEQ